MDDRSNQIGARPGEAERSQQSNQPSRPAQKAAWDDNYMLRIITRQDHA
jgi:hypothetical protein